MPKIPKYSVVIINYNQPKQLPVVLQSFNHQSCAADIFEVIVVDDGSMPRLERELRHVAPNYALHYHYLPRNEQSCRAKARNYGARLARGDYLVFIDGDSVASPQLIEGYARYFSIHKTRKVVLGSRMELSWQTYQILRDGTQPEDTHKILATRPATTVKTRITSLLGIGYADLPGNWALFTSCNFCIEKSAFVAAGGFEESFKGWGSEDTEFAYRLAKMGWKHDVLENFVHHLPFQAGDLDGRYKEWLHNIGHFYQLHRDPAILLLMVFEALVFEWFCNKGPWNEDHYLTTFLNFHSRYTQLQQQS